MLNSYCLTIKHHSDEEDYIDTAPTIQMLHEVRERYLDVISDSVSGVEIYEVDENGYRVPGKDVIYHLKLGVPTQPKVTFVGGEFLKPGCYSVKVGDNLVCDLDKAVPDESEYS